MVTSQWSVKENVLIINHVHIVNIFSLELDKCLSTVIFVTQSHATRKKFGDQGILNETNFVT